MTPGAEAIGGQALTDPADVSGGQTVKHPSLAGASVPVGRQLVEQAGFILSTFVGKRSTEP